MRVAGSRYITSEARVWVSIHFVGGGAGVARWEEAFWEGGGRDGW